MAILKRFRLDNTLSSWVSVVIPVVAVILASSQLLLGSHTPRKPSSIDNEVGELRGQLIVRQAEVDRLKVENTSLTASLNAGTSAPQLESLTRRLKALEDALGSDPAKALQVPLLRSDLDNFKANTATSISATKSDIDRVFDVFKFSIGALGIGLLGQAAGSVLLRKRDAQGAVN